MSKKVPKKKIQKSIWLWPVYFASGIVPLIVYLKRVQLEGILFTTWMGSHDFGDFFSYYKSIAIIVAAFSCLALLYWRKKANKLILKNHTEFLPALVYVIFVIISTVLSEHVQVALFGYIERHEGAFILISYIIVCFYTAVVIDKQEEILKVLSFIGISCFIIGIIGTMQYFGRDFFQTQIGMKLIVPPKYYSVLDTMKVEFGGKIIYGTFNNPNYIGSYASMMLVLSLGLVCYFEDKKKKLITGILFCGSAILLLVGSISSAGLVGALLGITLFLILNINNIIRDWRYIGGFVLVILAAAVVNHLSDGRILSELRNLNPLSEIEKFRKASSNFYVDEIKSENNKLVIRTNKETIKMELRDNGLNFSNERDEVIEPEYVTNVYYFENNAYERYKVLVIEPGFEYLMNIGKLPIRVRYVNGEFQKVTAANGTVKIENAQALPLFKGIEKIGTGRGYIWSRTIPMLKNTIIKGYGPDTFAIYFPQGDLAGKINGLNDANIIVDKPHNWYLHTAVNTGVISLISLLVFVLMYIFTALKSYIQAKNSQQKLIQATVLAAILSYCVAALFNDSVVSVAPVFWVLLGLGIAQNRIVKNQKG